MSEQQLAWRTYAAAGIAAQICDDSLDEIPALCHIAAEVADEMVRRETDRAKCEEE